MNAITLPKNPPTAMMGIRISISSSRRRSFARSDPLALAVLREQPFGEVHALGELRHLAPHGLELLIERILLFRELRSSRPCGARRSEEHTSELQSRGHLVC